MKTSTKDLTNGSPTKLVLGFMAPFLFGLLFQQIYNLIDTFIVGKMIGLEALAGVGSTGAVNFLIIGACDGLCSGFSIPIARKFGEKNIPEIKNFVGNIIWLVCIISAVLTVICSVFCHNILELMRTPDETFRFAYDYIFFIFLGIPVTIAYNTLASMMRAVGDSKTPVIILMSASVLNVVLDVLLIGAFEMGVSGASIATVISQFFAALICFIVVKTRFQLLHPSKQNLRPRKKHLSQLCSMGFPMALQTSITGIGTVVLQSAVNELEYFFIAANVAASKISGLMMTPYNALGITMATYAGQNAGAGKVDRIRKGLRSALVIGTLYTIASGLILFFFGGNIASIFVENKEDINLVVPYAHQQLIFTGFSYILLLFIFCFRSLIQGIGYARPAMLAGVLEMIARTFGGIYLVPKYGFLGACISGPLAWAFASILLIPLYFRCMKKFTTLLQSRTLVKKTE